MVSKKTRIGKDYQKIEEVLEYSNQETKDSGDIINYAYLGNEKLKTENIILLTGERKVSVGADGDEQDLLAVAAKHNIRDLKNLTELI